MDFKEYAKDFLVIMGNSLQEKKSYNIPNLISLARLLFVPYIVWMLLNNNFLIAFYLILAVSLSDAVDGFIARRLNCKTVLGHYLDPLADKALLISLYLTLAFKGFLPTWLAITVVSRDALIVGGVIISNILNKPLKIKPLLISKTNTVLQIFLILYILIFYLTGNWHNSFIQNSLTILYTLTFLTTCASGLAYIILWMKNTNKVVE